MKLIQLQPKMTDSMPDDKLAKAYRRLHKVLAIAETKPLSESTISKINEKVQELNASTKINGALYRLVNLTENEIITILEQDIDIVPVGHYSKKWTAVGITLYGIPFGIILGLLTHNMGLFAIGLPIGLGIGALIGRSKDAQAAAQGRQYDIAI